MKTVDLSASIYTDLGSPSGISIPYLCTWFVANLGELNNLITTTYSGVSGQISPELIDEDANIFKHIFYADYYERLAVQNMNAAGVDWVYIQEGDSTIRRASSNDRSKTFLSLQKQAIAKLDMLIKLYRANQSIPRDIRDDGNITDPETGVTSIEA